jgi:DNA-binding transcriptional LysR family regulator
LINLDIDSLRTFVTLADNKSFTLTAERVARTQSTVSAQIKKLEDRLGFVVFERNRRSFSVTPRGEALLGYARQVLQLHDEGVQHVLHGAISGSIRLGVTDYFVPRALPNLLMRFRALYPEARVEVMSGVTGELLAKKKLGELDIVIGRRDVEPDLGTSSRAQSGVVRKAKLRPTVLRREKLFWVAARDRALVKRFTSAIIVARDELPLAVLPLGCGVRAQAIKVLDQARHGWYIAYCGQSVLSLQTAIAAGVGVGALTESALTDDVVMLSKRDGFPALNDSEIVLYPAAAPTSEVSALTELLVSLFASAALD